MATMATTLPPGDAAVADPFTIWTVGDICDDDNEALDCADVGDLVAAGSPDYFVPLGDIQYEKGALSAFNRFYHPKVDAKLLGHQTRGREPRVPDHRRGRLLLLLRVRGRRPHQGLLLVDGWQLEAGRSQLELREDRRHLRLYQGRVLVVARPARGS